MASIDLDAGSEEAAHLQGFVAFQTIWGAKIRLLTEHLALYPCIRGQLPDPA
jgi:hypothetical protein